MKRILKMILTGILLFCMAFSIVGCGEESGMTGSSKMEDKDVLQEYNIELLEYEQYKINPEYKNANLTKGAEGTTKDMELPNSRVNIIENQEELDRAFLNFSNINFEEKIVLVYFYTEIYSYPRYLRSAIMDGNKNIKIELLLIDTTPPGVGNASIPRTVASVVEMDKVEFNSIEFIRIVQ